MKRTENIRQAGRKLKSPQGASITIAMLFFLVCAVVGAVILAAGTASAGRLASLTKDEQRYASVTSAAELMRKQIQSDTVTVTSVEIDGSYTTYNVEKIAGENGQTTNIFTATSVNNFKKKNPTDEEIGTYDNVAEGTHPDKIESKSEDGSVNPDSFLAAGLRGWQGHADDPDYEYKITFTIKPSEATVSGLEEVKGTLKMEKDGQILLDLYNDADAPTDQFHVNLSCTPRVVTDTKRVNEDSDKDGNITWTNPERTIGNGWELMKTTTTAVKTYTWHDVTIERMG